MAIVEVVAKKDASENRPDAMTAGANEAGQRAFYVRAPATSANLGPGFDTFGMALGLYLHVDARFRPAAAASPRASVNLLTEDMSVTYVGPDKDQVPTSPNENLIVQVYQHVARCIMQHRASDHALHGEAFVAREDTKPADHVSVSPLSLQSLYVTNEIPLGGGLGSSASAIIAGALLAYIAVMFPAKHHASAGPCTPKRHNRHAMDDALHLTAAWRTRLLTWCLAFEPHPDNLAPCLCGGFVTSFCQPMASEALSPSSSSSLTDASSDPTPQSPVLWQTVPVPLARKGYLSLLTVKPAFSLSTALARSVLPATYAPQDVVYNLQRATMLCQWLSCTDPETFQPRHVYACMSDKLHQPYRLHLIPGLAEVFETVTPEAFPGLCGLCLSGAGPTLLALFFHATPTPATSTCSMATSKHAGVDPRHRSVADAICRIFGQQVTAKFPHGIACRHVRSLAMDVDGATFSLL